MRFLLNTLIITLLGHSVHAQIFNPNIEKEISDVNKCLRYLKEFEGLGIKEPGTIALSNTADWLKAKYAGFGYSDIRIDTFSASGYKQVNVIARKQGILNDFIVVGGHYDTESGPGVNDNGTGTAAILYAAEHLQSLTSAYTIYFINFSGEEDGFNGSRHFVDAVLDTLPGTCQLMINLDQLGGTVGSAGNDRINCERDELPNPSTNNLRSAAVTDTLAKLTEIYSTLTPVISAAFSSDYIPFENEGYVITGLYQYSSFSQRHTLLDSFNLVDTASFLEVTRVATAAVLHFARIPQFIGISGINSKAGKFWVDAEGRLQFTTYNDLKLTYLRIFNSTGQEVFYSNSYHDGEIQLSNIKPGAYVVQYGLNTNQIGRSRIIIPIR